MGQHLLTPVSAGIRQRDDYGAAAGITLTPARNRTTLLPQLMNSRSARSFPVVQPRKVDAMGRLNHVA